MLKHYLKLACHNLLKQPLYSLLNIIGLGISLSVCLMIGLFVHHELTYDSQFRDSDRIYRIGQLMEGNPFATPGSSSAMLSEQMKSFAGIEAVTRTSVSVLEPVMLTSETVEDREGEVIYADRRFTDIFGLDWRYGEPGSVLQSPDSIALSETLARKYFGSIDAARGNSLQYDGNELLRVTGIFRDLPSNTHFQTLHAILPIALLDAQEATLPLSLESWGSNWFRTYVRLEETAEDETIQSGLNDLAENGLGEFNGYISFVLEPLRSIHLNQRGGGLIESNRLRIVIFLSVGLAVLIIAVVNFMNLATARATTRIREVGVRAALGALRAQLRRQFLVESMLMTLLALIVGLALAELCLPVINSLLELELSLMPFTSPGGVALLTGAVLIIGLLAGSYPAFFLSALRPIAGLRGEWGSGSGGLWVRRALVVFQFSIAIMLIVSSAVVLLQMWHMRTLDRGFQAENVVTVALPRNTTVDLDSRWPVIRNSLTAHPGVQAAVYASVSPLPESLYLLELYREGAEEQHTGLRVSAEAGYLPFYGVPLLAGRYPGPAGDGLMDRADLATTGFRAGIVVNATAVKALGWQPREALGEVLFVRSGAEDDDRAVGTIVGVVVDLINNPRRSIMPTVYGVPESLTLNGSGGGIASVRLRPDDTADALRHIQAVWQEHFPDAEADPAFLDSRVAQQSRKDNRQLQLFLYTTGFAILVACFGLYGLATFSTQRRIKEIGVRKVMGGSRLSIVGLLTKEFSYLVLAANLIAWPVAWIAMQRWLENFAYQIELTPLIFIGSGLIALCIAWVTVGSTAARAVNTKPVRALRYE